MQLQRNTAGVYLARYHGRPYNTCTPDIRKAIELVFNADVLFWDGVSYPYDEDYSNEK